MPWSLVRQSTSCSRMAIVETVSRPSYTLARGCRRPEGSLPLLVWVAAAHHGLPPSAIGLDSIFLFLTAGPRAALPLSSPGESDGQPSPCRPSPVHRRGTA